MVLEERIREKQHEILSNYCSKCRNNCCDCRKHLVPIDAVSLPLFQEKGISRINPKQLKKSSLKNWVKHPNSRLLFKNGEEVPKPSIVPYDIWLYKHKNYLYADTCPFYTPKNGCEIHEDSRRPKDCKDYPLVILPESGDPKGRLDVMIMKSCPCKEELKSTLEKSFSIRVVN